MIAASSLVFLILHLPYLPRSLEDLDSINFALGMRRFDVAAHQPHPPGYPVFIVLARSARLLIHDEARALAAVGIVAGALGIVAAAAFFRRLDDRERVWLPATLVAFTAPLYWFTASRPLSDMAGLAAVLGVQAAIVSASGARARAAAALVAGVAAGIRSQVVWLTAPLLLWAVIAARPDREDGGPERPAPHTGWPADAVARPAPHTNPVARPAPHMNPVARPAPHMNPVARPAPHMNPVARPFQGRVLLTAAAYVVGILLWAVPLVAISGGPAAYWRAVFEQGAEDLSGIRMLWTTPTARELVDALYYAFVAPWAIWPLAVPVIAFAIAGTIVVLRTRRRAALILAIAFGPYLLFDIVFQETFTSRYALPIVVPLAYLAAAGASALPRQLAIVAVALIAIGSAHVGGSTLAAYSRQKAPAFRLLDDMKSVAAKPGDAPVLAFDRREALDLRRPIAWVGDAMPAMAQRLPSPPQHEWLDLVKYWNSGGRAPVWFIADPLRADVRLFDHGDPTEYAWSLPYPLLISGVRPDSMNWYRITSPRWYVAEGWALTPESAGIAQAERAGPSKKPIDAWVNRYALGGAVLVGGRNFSPQPTTVTVAADPYGNNRPALRVVAAPPGFFAEMVRFGISDPFPPGDFVRIQLSAPQGSSVAIEQFDATALRQPIVGFGAGWNEPEYNPQTGTFWRWMSGRAELLVSDGARALHLEGESPRKYFSRGSRVIIRAAGETAFDQVVDADFSITVPIPPANTVTITTDQFYSPAERSRFWRRSRDQRQLGLRIFTCEVR